MGEHCTGGLTITGERLTDSARFNPKTTGGDDMPDTDPAQLHRHFEERFNAGDLAGLLALYEPDAALITEPGALSVGLDGIGAALQGFLDLGGQISLDTKQVVTVGDLAFLTNRWSLTGTNPDGTQLEMGAITAEVARRQDDGSWLYVIDNAIGDAASDD